MKECGGEGGDVPRCIFKIICCIIQTVGYMTENYLTMHVAYLATWTALGVRPFVIIHCLTRLCFLHSPSHRYINYACQMLRLQPELNKEMVLILPPCLNEYGDQPAFWSMIID